MDPVGVFGAGAIGAYVGARLASSRDSPPVLLNGRSLITHLQSNAPLTCSDLFGFAHTFERVPCLSPSEECTPKSWAAGPLLASAEFSHLAACPTILVCLKSDSTTAAANDLNTLPPLESGSRRLVVSLQNGAKNAIKLRNILDPTRFEVAAGMVEFGVLWTSPATFHRTTDGRLFFEDNVAPQLMRPLVQALNAAGVPSVVHADMPAVLYGKLLFNLINGVNALAGRGVGEMLESRLYRHIWATCVEEALAVYRRSSIRPYALRLPCNWIPLLLRMPNWVYSIATGRIAKIDRHGRSSMLQDLDARRDTEVDHINGEIIRLANTCAVPVPVNQAMVRLLRLAEAGRAGSPMLADTELAEKLGVGPPPSSVVMSLCVLVPVAALVTVPLVLARWYFGWF